jgi:hypothetical protein
MFFVLGLWLGWAYLTKKALFAYITHAQEMLYTAFLFLPCICRSAGFRGQTPSVCGLLGPWLHDNRKPNGPSATRTWVQHGGSVKTPLEQTANR